MSFYEFGAEQQDYFYFNINLNIENLSKLMYIISKQFSKQKM